MLQSQKLKVCSGGKARAQLKPSFSGKKSCKAKIRGVLNSNQASLAKMLQSQKLEVCSGGKAWVQLKSSFFGKNIAAPKIRGVLRWKSTGSHQTKLFFAKMLQSQKLKVCSGRKARAHLKPSFFWLNRCNVKIRGVLRWKSLVSTQSKVFWQKCYKAKNKRCA
jgi:hypothetical protein